jgi:hypothetical protein
LDLEDNKPGCDRAEELHKLYAEWERCVSKEIHRAVYETDAGRQALREFHGISH